MTKKQLLRRAFSTAHAFYRLLANGEDRARWRIINEDYKTWRTRIPQFVRSAPVGDPTKSALMILHTSSIMAIKLEAVLSLALRLWGLHPYLLELSPNRWRSRHHKLWGNCSTIYYRQFWPTGLDDGVESELTAVLGEANTISKLISISWHGVAVGRTLLSNLMYRHKFDRLDLTRQAFKDELAIDLRQVQRNILAAEAMVDTFSPRMVFLVEKGLSPIAEIFGVCMARNIPVVEYAGSQEMNSFILKRYSRENHLQASASLGADTWRRVISWPWWSPEIEDAFMNDFAASYRDGTWFNRKFLHHDKMIKPADEVRNQLGLDPGKKTATIFSHVLWDATFFYGEGLFEDYETWLLETVKAACANTQVNWIIKLHPDLVWKLKYENYTGELRDVIAMRSAVGKLPDHVKLVLPETDINTYSFFSLTDYCLTVRGTIGIEMACHGIPVITAGTGRYSHLGFTIDPFSPSAYIDLLNRIEDLPPMTATQIELARRYAYALFRVRPWRAKSFEIVRKPLESIGHPLDYDLILHSDNLESFSCASDIRNFGNWIVSGETDYMEPTEASE